MCQVPNQALLIQKFKDSSCPQGAYSLVGRQTIKQANKPRVICVVCWGGAGGRRDIQSSLVEVKSKLRLDRESTEVSGRKENRNGTRAMASLHTGGRNPECKASDKAREGSRDQNIRSLTSHAKGSGLYPEGSEEPWKVLGQGVT